MISDISNISNNAIIEIYLAIESNLTPLHNNNYNIQQFQGARNDTETLSWLYYVEYVITYCR